MSQEINNPISREELGKAISLVQKNGLTVLCSQLRTVEEHHLAQLNAEVKTLKHQRKRKRGFVVGVGVGRAGRPLSAERKIARAYALEGRPYVDSLYIAKMLSEAFPPPNYKKLKRGFDLEYREHGVEPPPAPTGWARYSLGDVGKAGWPSGWEDRWRPELKCWLCGRLIEDDYQRASMNGKYGFEMYPVHPACGENQVAKHRG